ncbi:MAG: hypothetical protein F6K50_25710 [Moorea sp. SIO3I7]|uniref:hypothetical protein n=1 Tax=Moorena sp. SIO3I8 TaxID=2607833 RepID=UPI0013C1C5CC|nr:hypothetical protein [Moorena sp. SIO3I8]NEN98778.1 hypothetical protein [Moorena sp. SIO3I7]NEO04342.1 hypothetical protein [Moorena sp. SIO3I8]
MKYPIRVLLSLLTLCTIGLGTNNVSAESNQCREIRAVRRLAIRENLDRDNLATLEDKYCGNNNLPSSSIESPLNSSEDCFDLTAMAKLASMTEDAKSFVGMIEGLKQVTCKRPRQGQRSTLYWQNGKTAKWASNWYYPNGQRVKGWSGWYYPNGETATSGSDWNYPNGNRATLFSQWYTPEGRGTSVDSLLTQGCSIVSTRECDRILAAINRSDTDRSEDKNSDRKRRNNLWRNLAIVKLSWQTYQQTNQSK